MDMNKLNHLNVIFGCYSYMMMRRCWERSTEDRPSFKMLKEMIQDYRRKSVGPNGADNFAFEGEQLF